MPPTKELPKCECTRTEPSQCDCGGTCERKSDSEVTTVDGSQWLCDQCADYAVEAVNDKWAELKSDLRKALVKWYNVESDEDLDNADRGALIAIAEAGRFWFWDCVMCGSKCAHGDPEDWRDFQGVDNQDYDSYPGNAGLFTVEGRYAMCDTCRRKRYKVPADGRTPFPYRGE